MWNEKTLKYKFSCSKSKKKKKEVEREIYTNNSSAQIIGGWLKDGKWAPGFLQSVSFLFTSNLVNNFNSQLNKLDLTTMKQFFFSSLVFRSANRMSTTKVKWREKVEELGIQKWSLPAYKCRPNHGRNGWWRHVLLQLEWLDPQPIQNANEVEGRTSRNPSYSNFLFLLVYVKNEEIFGEF